MTEAAFEYDSSYDLDFQADIVQIMHDEQPPRIHEALPLQQSGESPASAKARQDQAQEIVVHQPLKNK